MVKKTLVLDVLLCVSVTSSSVAPKKLRSAPSYTDAASKKACEAARRKVVGCGEGGVPRLKKCGAYRDFGSFKRVTNSRFVPESDLVCVRVERPRGALPAGTIE